MTRSILAAAILALSATATYAGPIERACLRSDRQAASRALCGCIQQVADRTLTNADQRQAAKFFRDPHKAQEVRQSSRAAQAAFWKRYSNFGATAEAFCAQG